MQTEETHARLTEKNHPIIAFLGGGNIAQALITGLVLKDYPKDKICASLRREKAKKSWPQQLADIRVITDNNDAIKHCQLVVICVKPQDLSLICQKISPVLSQYPVPVVSVAAGASIEFLQNHLPRNIRITRAMPNISAMFGEGTTGLHTKKKLDGKTKALVALPFGITGRVFWLKKEESLRTITALCGSGPAYWLRLYQSFVQAASALQTEENIAHNVVFSTLRGVLALLEKHPEHTQDISSLIHKVASKGGTTEAGLRTLDQHHVPEGILHTILDGVRRIEEIESLLQ